MERTRLHELFELGQSPWLDFIQRSLIVSGGLNRYIEQGLRGVTSNPSLFEKAIADSREYDDQILALARQDRSTREIYEQLTVEDSRRAADVLRPVFDASQGEDGFFSLEVEPDLAHDSAGSMASARHLSGLVDRPNLMIKLPATPEGLPAIHELIAEGLNINITLMFSLEQYDQVAEAYISALEKRAARSQEIAHIASVASIFVSRVDTLLDKQLEALGTPQAMALRGRIGIANAKIAYQHFKQAFSGERWEALARRGARVQRVLYGSTGTKNPAYPDTMYVDSLIGPQTVNTIPPETLAAFLDHGKAELTLEKDLDQARQQLELLAALGIELDDITDQVLKEGVEKFIQPFHSLLQTIENRKKELTTA